MSVKQDSLFCTLPVELIYHIFRYLDAQTIVRSIRIVCKRFYTIVNVYDKFNFNFDSIVKSDFHYLCNLILPRNVKSLTLSNSNETPGQIEYFLSRFRIKQFIQLNSLNLFQIDDCQLGIILKDIQKLQLTSLSINSKQDYSDNNTISDDLSSAISLPSLQKLTLNIPSCDISKIVWPIGCTIQHLYIYCRTIDEYCNILYTLPNLRTLVVEGLNMDDTSGIIPNLPNLTAVCQLFSLTFKYCTLDTAMLEFLLSFTPTLEHFHLIQSIDLDVFISYLPQWQTFIETKLLLLNKFNFFLVRHAQLITIPVDTEQLMTPFRTTFWTETKQWFVICDYIMSSNILILYSSSFFDPQFEFIFESKQISRSTSTSTINNTIIMDEVQKLRLDLTKMMISATSPQGGLPNKTIFPNLDQLTLCLTDSWPLCSLRALSTLINLSHLTKVSLEFLDSFDYYSESMTNIGSLLKLAHNIHSLTISISSLYKSITDDNMEICSIIPDHNSFVVTHAIENETEL
ncbi:unnamed protein product [Adineta steineri]|uniref:F-box domain-containing protein n=1 Tax=Adineta steineri TaxID=433720 RepID=A0A815ETE0_9BILA|nr:unnamed protein product [Adineta steineri]CAF1310564.1 unnamed protein product [Adineta steineri]CAF1580131.1 unnamed protein product [Adineta steineri]